MSPIAWALAFIITVMAAGVQGSVGMGFAIISVPILSLIDPGLAPAPQLIAILPLTLVMAWRERQALDFTGFWWIIAGRIPGAFVGVALLAVASRRTLDIFIAVIVLLAVGILGARVHVRHTPATKLAAGVASGTSGVVASIGGPALALLYSSENSDTLRSTLAAVFAIGATTSIIFRASSGNLTLHDVGVGIILIPAVLVGYAASTYVKSRIAKDQVRVGVLVLSAMSAAALLIRVAMG